MNCSECKFVDVFIGEVLMTYECHRYPPVLVTLMKDIDDDEDDYAEAPVQLYPQVSEDDWCGEFKEKEDVSRNNQASSCGSGDSDPHHQESEGGSR